MKKARFTGRGTLAIDPGALGLEVVVAEVQERPAFTEHGSFAVVDVYGPLMQRTEPACLWDSYEAIGARVDAALASALPNLLLRVNSPGGEVAGCFELSEQIRTKAAARGKRVFAYVDGMAASAAYALACSAERIFVPPSGIVGSIGCIKLAVDQTGMDRAMGLSFSVVASGARKADGNPHVPASEQALAAMQAEVDAMASVFFALVAKSRGLPMASVGALQAATFVGGAGVAAGLADEITTFDALLTMGTGVTQTRAQKGAEETMDEEKEKAIAALKALAESDDEEKSKAAKAALKALGADDGEPTKGEGDDKKPDAKAEGGEDEKDPPKSAPKPDASKASASVAKDPTLALAATVQELTAKIAAREEQEERTKLLASRPDLTPEVRAFLERQPIKVLRDAVKTLPKGKASGAKNAVEGARAGLQVAPTVGATQGDSANALPESEAHELDVRMGLAKRVSGIRHEGTKLVLGVMTPADARAELAKRGGAR